MSIILEALKKVSVTRTTPPVAAKAAVRVPAGKIEAKKEDIQDSYAFNPTRTMLMGIAAVVIVGTVSFFMFRQPGTLEAGKSPAVSASQAAVKTTAEGYSSVPIPAAAKPDTTPISSFITKLSNPRLNLTGIVYGIGKPTAIIENRILEEGASIRGAKVVKIRKDSVEMLDEVTGQSFVLKLD